MEIAVKWNSNLFGQQTTPTSNNNSSAQDTIHIYTHHIYIYIHSIMVRELLAIVDIWYESFFIPIWPNPSQMQFPYQPLGRVPTYIHTYIHTFGSIVGVVFFVITHFSFSIVSDFIHHFSFRCWLTLLSPPCVHALLDWHTYFYKPFFRRIPVKSKIHIQNYARKRTRNVRNRHHCMKHVSNVLPNLKRGIVRRGMSNWWPVWMHKSHPKYLNWPKSKKNKTSKEKMRGMIPFVMFGPSK